MRRDDNRMPSSHPLYDGAESITDASGGEKLWLVVNWDTATVSYKAESARVEPMPNYEDWYYLPDWDTPIYSSRAGD